jgi:uncharacterized SAM-binding protein YcdF (DUF218 family)
MSKIRKISTFLLQTLRLSLMVLGGIFLVMLIVACTSWPFWAQYRLGKAEAGLPEQAGTILVMGSGGFPSESVLMRLWYTIELAQDYPGAKVVVATPGEITDSASTVFQTITYLIDHQIAKERIVVEPEGLNTRHQALMAYELYRKGAFETPLVIVTSSEHVYRSVLSFRKAGFQQVSGHPATEIMLETDLDLQEEDLGGNMPVNASSINIRYQFWNYFQLEIRVLREYVAIAYYWVKGWI